MHLALGLIGTFLCLLSVVNGQFRQLHTPYYHPHYNYVPRFRRGVPSVDSAAVFFDPIVDVASAGPGFPPHHHHDPGVEVPDTIIVEKSTGGHFPSNLKIIDDADIVTADANELTAQEATTPSIDNSSDDEVQVTVVEDNSANEVESEESSRPLTMFITDNHPSRTESDTAVGIEQNSSTGFHMEFEPTTDEFSGDKEPALPETKENTENSIIEFHMDNDPSTAEFSGDNELGEPDSSAETEFQMAMETLVNELQPGNVSTMVEVQVDNNAPLVDLKTIDDPAMSEPEMGNEQSFQELKKDVEPALTELVELTTPEFKVEIEPTANEFNMDVESTTFEFQDGSKPDLTSEFLVEIEPTANELTIDVETTEFGFQDNNDPVTAEFQVNVESTADEFNLESTTMKFQTDNEPVLTKFMKDVESTIFESNSRASDDRIKDDSTVVNIDGFVSENEDFLYESFISSILAGHSMGEVFDHTDIMDTDLAEDSEVLDGRKILVKRQAQRVPQSNRLPLRPRPVRIKVVRQATLSPPTKNLSVTPVLSQSSLPPKTAPLPAVLTLMNSRPVLSSPVNFNSAPAQNSIVSVPVNQQPSARPSGTPTGIRKPSPQQPFSSAQPQTTGFPRDPTFVVPAPSVSRPIGSPGATFSPGAVSAPGVLQTPTTTGGTRTPISASVPEPPTVQGLPRPLALAPASQVPSVPLGTVPVASKPSVPVFSFPVSPASQNRPVPGAPRPPAPLSGVLQTPSLQNASRVPVPVSSSQEPSTPQKQPVSGAPRPANSVPVTSKPSISQSQTVPGVFRPPLGPAPPFVTSTPSVSQPPRTPEAPNPPVSGAAPHIPTVSGISRPSAPVFVPAVSQPVSTIAAPGNSRPVASSIPTVPKPPFTLGRPPPALGASFSAGPQPPAPPLSGGPRPPAPPPGIATSSPANSAGPSSRPSSGPSKPPVSGVSLVPQGSNSAPEAQRVSAFPLGPQPIRPQVQPSASVSSSRPPANVSIAEKNDFVNESLPFNSTLHLPPVRIPPTNTHLLTLASPVPLPPVRIPPPGDFSKNTQPLSIVPPVPAGVSRPVNPPTSSTPNVATTFPGVNRPTTGAQVPSTTVASLKPAEFSAQIVQPMQQPQLKPFPFTGSPNPSNPLEGSTTGQMVQPVRPPISSIPPAGLPLTRPVPEASNASPVLSPSIQFKPAQMQTFASQSQPPLQSPVTFSSTQLGPKQPAVDGTKPVLVSRPVASLQGQNLNGAPEELQFQRVPQQQPIQFQQVQEIQPTQQSQQFQQAKPQQVQPPQAQPTQVQLQQAQKFQQTQPQQIPQQVQQFQQSQPQQIQQVQQVQAQKVDQVQHVQLQQFAQHFQQFQQAPQEIAPQFRQPTVPAPPASPAARNMRRRSVDTDDTYPSAEA